MQPHSGALPVPSISVQVIRGALVANQYRQYSATNSSKPELEDETTESEEQNIG